MHKIDRKYPLTQERLKEVLNYDPETGIFIRRISTANCTKVGQAVGSLHKSTGYLRACIDSRSYLVHRLVWLYVHGEFPKGEKNQIDHIDGNRANNKLVNLKRTSHHENGRNQKKTVRNKSGINGIARIGTWNWTRTKKNYYWVAYWYNEHKKQLSRGFSIGKLGEENAKQLAINYRSEQIQLLEVSHNIEYSPRHGT